MTAQERGPVRIVFFGTAELACSSLVALLQDARFQVAGVVTQPDKPKGRDLRLTPSPVKELALQHGVSVIQPKRARAETFIEEIRGLSPELIVVVAYGQILPQALLDVPTFGALNVHTSLLPRHRGAAPIQWAIIEGDKETGVTIMKMDAGLDTGDILSQSRTPIAAEDNGQKLHDRLAKMGADLLIQTIVDWISGGIQPSPQPDGATYARKITKEDGQINWSEPAQTIWNKIRGFTPWPGAYTYLPGDKPRLLKVWSATPLDSGTAAPGKVIRAEKDDLIVACGTGALSISIVQKEGGKRLSAREFLSGHPLAVGTQLGGASAESVTSH